MNTYEYKNDVKNSIVRVIIAALLIIIQVFMIVNLAIHLSEYYAAFDTIMSIIAFICVLHIYGRPDNSAFKLSWIVLILIFPVFGLAIYILFGRPSLLKTVQKKFNKVNDDLNSYKIETQGYEELQQNDPLHATEAYYLQSLGFPTFNHTKIKFYSSTNDALEAQLHDLNNAKEFIFMEYHAIEDSKAWRQIEDILVEKVKQGVDVRVFYDDMGSVGFINNKFRARLHDEGIQCRVFNPIFPVLNPFMNNRDHRKITVIDGLIGYTGGYNLADEYFNYTHPYGLWKDSGVRLEGDAVDSLTKIFFEMWQTSSKEDNEDLTLYLKGHKVSGEGYIIPYSDTPLDDEETGENVYLNMIKHAVDHIYITTPYLILSDEMQRELILASKRGVDVRIITPGIPDKAVVFALTRSYYSHLVLAGIHIYEYTPGFIHSKQCLVDDQVGVVGTINFDFRSLYLHFENGCWFTHNHAVKELREDFDELFEISQDVSEKYINTSVVLRGWRCILRFFSPLM